MSFKCGTPQRGEGSIKILPAYGCGGDVKICTITNVTLAEFFVFFDAMELDDTIYAIEGVHMGVVLDRKVNRSVYGLETKKI